MKLLWGDGFGGLIISTDLRINLYYATYNHEEMKLENYQPPAPDRTIEDIKSNLSEINNTEKKKFVLFSKSPTSITFLFGYLYQAIFPETVFLITKISISLLSHTPFHE